MKNKGSRQNFDMKRWINENKMVIREDEGDMFLEQDIKTEVARLISFVLDSTKDKMVAKIAKTKRFANLKDPQMIEDVYDQFLIQLEERLSELSRDEDY